MAWMVLLACLVTALSSVVSSHFGAASSPAWLEICRARGVDVATVATVGDDSQAPGQPDAGSHAHGTACCLHFTAWGLPPAAWSGLDALTLAFAVPQRFLTAPRTPFVWAAAQARAPPVRS